MKKVQGLLAVLLVVFGLTACRSAEKDFEDMLVNMETVTSFRMDLTMEDVPILGTISGYFLVEDSMIQMSFLGTEGYMLEEDGKAYEIIEFLGEYYAIEVPLDQAGLDELSLISEDFDVDDFTLNDDGYYESAIIYDGLNHLQIKIEDGYMTEMRADVSADGITFTMIMELSGFNSTTVDFPDYTEMNTWIETLYELDSLGYEYTDITGGFVLEDWFNTITYTAETESYLIDDGWGTTATFYPATQEVEENGVTESLTLYITGNYYPIIDLEEFGYLTLLYENLE